MQVDHIDLWVDIHFLLKVYPEYKSTVAHYPRMKYNTHNCSGVQNH